MKNNSGFLTIFILISVVFHLIFLFLKFPAAENSPAAEPELISVSLNRLKPPEELPPEPPAPIPEHKTEPKAEQVVQSSPAEIAEAEPAFAPEQEAASNPNTPTETTALAESAVQAEVQTAVNPFAELMQRVNEMKYSVYPLRAKKKGYQGTVVVELKLDSDGNLIDAVIVQECRYSILDKAAIELVELVLNQPYPHALGRNVTLKMPITFKLL